jgi:molecular chaperone GrpE
MGLRKTPRTRMPSKNDGLDSPAGVAEEPHAGAEPEITAPDSFAHEREELVNEKNELQSLLQRRQAEFENFKRRVERERSELLEFASTNTIKALLPILDDFARALKVESADKEYVRGMELIYQRLYESLTKLGLEPISTEGATFDPHIHHAVDMVETKDRPDHTILKEYERGYNFKGRLLRPAMVQVAVNH